MNLLLSVLGYWGPYILLVTTSFALMIYNNDYLIVYLFFSVVGTMINYIVKSAIKQPRPKRQKHLYDFEHKQKHGQEYGMPSGHAQNSFYSLFTVLFNIPNLYFILLSILLTCNTCYQRWVYRNHTISQIIVGSLTGIMVFCLAYKASEANLHRFIQI